MRHADVLRGHFSIAVPVGWVRPQRCREDASSHNCHKCVNDGHRDRNTCLLKNILYATECWGSLDERVASAPCGDNCSFASLCIATSSPPHHVIFKFWKNSFGTFAFPVTVRQTVIQQVPLKLLQSQPVLGLDCPSAPSLFLGRKLAQVLGHGCVCIK